MITGGMMGREIGSTCRCISLFFFSSRRRHTRFDCDWSSDVCSSDLNQLSRGLISLSLLPTSHPRNFQLSPVRTFTRFYPRFILLMGRSPPLRVYYQRLGRPFWTRFRFASSAERLRLATDNNSQTH